jgi:hypothetical protein
MTRQSNMGIMPTDRGTPKGPFYIGWIVLSTVCIPIAYLITMIILKIITGMVGDYVYVDGVRHITEDYLAIYILVPIASVLTGAMQYGLLRRFLRRSGWWVPATFAGWLLGILLIALPGWMRWIDSPLNNSDLILLMMGFAIGLTQWLVLRGQVAQAGWWIVANSLGWALVGLVIPGNGLDQYGLILLGLLPACATAAMVAVLMHRVPLTGPRE